MSDNEIILESRLEQALSRENDHKNCANCSHFKDFMSFNYCDIESNDGKSRKDFRAVCSKHEWDKMERMERSYD